MLECRYKGNCCVTYHRPFDSDELPCDGYDKDICSLYEPMPDVKALKGLANELDELEKHYDGKYKDTYNLFYSGVAEGIYIAADMLREALGVDDA